MTLNRPAVNSINYDDPPATADSLTDQDVASVSAAPESDTNNDNDDSQLGDTDTGRPAFLYF